MGKRVREVYDVDMVAHIWANQSQECARNQRRNFYFSGDTIYSYGSHFPIARHVAKGKRKCVLFTTRSYSSTTAGHKCVVRNAVRGQTVFEVKELCHGSRGWGASVLPNHRDNLADYRSRIMDTAKQATRARSNKAYLLSCLDSLVDEANAYAKFFGLRSVVKVPTEVDIKAEREKSKRTAAAAEKKAAKQRAEAIALAEKHLVDWKAGADERSHSLHWLPDTYLRVRGDEIETSRGATVPLPHATRLLPLIRSGTAYQRNGHSEHVGHFVVDSISVEGDMKVGCHFIKRAEIERIATQLGL